MTDPDRIRCCVTGCGRTFKRGDPWEYLVICGRHWRMGPPAWRRRHTRLLRRYRQQPSERLADIVDRSFDRVRAQVEEIVAGRITDATLDTFVNSL